MARIVILLAFILVAFLMWHKIRSANKEEKKKLIIGTGIGFIIAVLVVLAATGRLNIITALIGGLIALMPKALSLLRYLPLLNRFRQQTGQTSNQQNSQHASSNHDAMTKQKAAEVLGIKSNASKEEIIAAHRRMMQKMHPDRGGSDFLAAQINQAKDTLLG
jgi:cadmium resistance protein CadD (predicted permease)